MSLKVRGLGSFGSLEVTFAFLRNPKNDINAAVMKATCFGDDLLVFFAKLCSSSGVIGSLVLVPSFLSLFCPLIMQRRVELSFVGSVRPRCK